MGGLALVVVAVAAELAMPAVLVGQLAVPPQHLGALVVPVAPEVPQLQPT